MKHTWQKYSAKLKTKILNPVSFGTLKEKSDMRLAIGEAGSFAQGNSVRIYLLVDSEDGIIADAKYQAFGETALIGGLEILCPLSLRKNYHQASRISADMIEQKVGGFPSETYPHLNLILEALEEACAQVSDIPISIASPLEAEARSGDYPNWSAMTHAEKLEMIENVIDKDIRPYIELDAGGIEVVELKNECEITITYSGACVTCPSSIGSTLNAISEILRSKVHPSMIVAPDKKLLGV